MARVRGDRHMYESCDRCDRRSIPSFWVTDDVWERVVQGAYHRVCATCFDEMADEADIAYTFLAVHVITWSQSQYDEWPHLDVPCAECVGRSEREHFARLKAGEDVA